MRLKCKYGFSTCSFKGQVDFCNSCDGGQNYQMKEDARRPEKVTHLITGEPMNIKRINGDIVTCYLSYPYYLLKFRLLIEVAICHMDNLIFEN